MDPEPASPGPSGGFNRYSMTPENINDMRKQQQWHKSMVQEMMQVTKGSDKIAFPQLKDFLDSKLEEEGLEFDEDILENILKNVDVNSQGYLNVDEFAEGFIEAYLTLKTEKCK